VRPDGSLYGHNTDIGGFMAMAKHAGIEMAGRKAVILGSGGTRVSALEFIKEVESTAADIRSLIDGVI